MLSSSLRDATVATDPTGTIIRCSRAAMRWRQVQRFQHDVRAPIAIRSLDVKESLMPRPVSTKKQEYELLKRLAKTSSKRTISRDSARR